jgi:hypothetical protein
MASTIDLLAEDITVAANAIVGMRHEATSTTSGSVVGGQKIISLIIAPQSWTLQI